LGVERPRFRRRGPSRQDSCDFTPRPRPASARLPFGPAAPQEPSGARWARGYFHALNVNARVDEIAERIARRSREARGRYLERIDHSAARNGDGHELFGAFRANVGRTEEGASIFAA